MSTSRVYMPLHALRKTDLESILSIALPFSNNDETRRRFDYHHSRRTMLHFLLSMENTDNGDGVNKLIDSFGLKIDWSRVRQDYQDLKNVIEPYQSQNGAEQFGTYWELKKTGNIRPGPKQSRDYISKYRADGFKPEELKLYWNYEEIRQLKETNFNKITDEDTNKNLNNNPVSERKNPGDIIFKKAGIEHAVFEVPADKQVIVLDFADERMPGGYFLENARTQEEVCQIYLI